MSGGSFADFDSAPIGAAVGVRLLTNRALPGVVMLASSALLGLWMVYIRPAVAPLASFSESAARPPVPNPFGELSFVNGDASPQDVARSDSLAASKPTTGGQEIEDAARFDRTFPANPYGVLAELNPTASRTTMLLPGHSDLDLEGGPIPGENQVSAAPLLNAPLPPRRPADLGVLPGPAPEPPSSLASHDANPPAQNAPGFFERLFAGARASQGQAVAYANPETTTISRSTPQSAILRSVAPSWGSAPSALARYDKFTAVYDIGARIVYLPDGRRLEAHSGLGDLKDDPKHVDTHARGATPPDVYELGLREGLFHGVQALRLKPVGSGEQFGRTGLLAHPYMLGPDGDSFGCVSFKDYDAFLNAYQSGQVKKLAVVAKLD